MIKTILIATSSLLLVACGPSADLKGAPADNQPVSNDGGADNPAPAAKSDLTLTYFNLGG